MNEPDNIKCAVNSGSQEVAEENLKQINTEPILLKRSSIKYCQEGGGDKENWIFGWLWSEFIC